jgi:hypothetical protein
MTTLAQIAASFGVQPIELSILVGLGKIDPDAELRPEQAAFVVNTVDCSDFFGSVPRGRHRFR